MSTTSIRVEKQTHQRLSDLSVSQHRPMAKIVEDAIAIYEKELFWEAMEEGYAQLNANPEDRAAFDAEVSAWDSTLNDGLEDYPYDEPAEATASGEHR